MSPFTTIYGDNNFGQVAEFDLSNEFVEECILPLGIGDDCEEFFSVSENQKAHKLVLNVDIFGREVLGEQSSLIISIYDDGSIKKNHYLNH